MPHKNASLGLKARLISRTSDLRSVVSQRLRHTLRFALKNASFALEGSRKSKNAIARVYAGRFVRKRAGQVWAGPAAAAGLAGGPCRSLCVATYNIHKCVGTDGVFNPERIIEVLAEMDADLVALQEGDTRFGARAGLLDLERLRGRCGLVPVHFGQVDDRHGWHGNIVLVRAGAAMQVHPVDLPGVEPRGAMLVEMDHPHGRFKVLAAHLGLLRHSRVRQVRAILRVLEQDGAVPTLILGDFNEWRRGRRSVLHGFGPAFGAGIMPAPPSFPSRFPVLSLDRIFANPPQMIQTLGVHDSPLARRASDHLPVVATIALP